MALTAGMCLKHSLFLDSGPTVNNVLSYTVSILFDLIWHLFVYFK